MPRAADKRELRRRALALLDAELAQLRAAGQERLRELAANSPFTAERDGIALTSHVDREGESVLVLVEAQRGRRTFGTGGFVMRPDGTTYTPH